MTRTRRAITLLALWMAMFFAGPVLPALAASCASSMPASAVAECRMEQGTGKAAAGAAKGSCCCPSGSMQAPEHPEHALLQTVSAATFVGQDTCPCSMQSGSPRVPAEKVQAPLPTLAAALSDTPVISAIPPLAHLAADAPLPPFAARLRLPQRARDTGRAPPTLA